MNGMDAIGCWLAPVGCRSCATDVSSSARGAALLVLLLLLHSLQLRMQTPFPPSLITMQSSIQALDPVDMQANVDKVHSRLAPVGWFGGRLGWLRGLD
jgi:hypothetical protein